MRYLLLAFALSACTFSPGDVRGGDDGHGNGNGHGQGNEPKEPDEDEASVGCVPLTCADVGAECGPQADDGCGKALDCGSCGGGGGTCADSVCVCASDEMEPNDLPGSAHDLGLFIDEDGGDTDVSDLVVRDAGDEDWFTFRVADDPGFTNPDFTVTLAESAAVHELEVYYKCDAGGDGSTCDGAEITSDLGVGCRMGGANPAIHMHASCATASETGTAWARVTRPTWDGICQGYGLHVAVNE